MILFENYKQLEKQLLSAYNTLTLYEDSFAEEDGLSRQIWETKRGIDELLILLRTSEIIK